MTKGRAISSADAALADDRVRTEPYARRAKQVIGCAALTFAEEPTVIAAIRASNSFALGNFVARRSTACEALAFALKAARVDRAVVLGRSPGSRSTEPLGRGCD